MDALAPLIQALQSEGRLRVWSLVITIFGDSVEPRGGRIATARLLCLMERIGVEEGALRTALSRLAADGWVRSERTGRSSSYQLTRTGRAQAAEATARIYRPPSDPVTRWTLAMGGTPPGDAIRLGGDGWLLPSDAGSRNPAQTGADVLITGALTALPGLAERVVGTSHAAALTALRADLATLGGLRDPDPLTAAAARTLLVHRWRRLVLRFPDIPAGLLPPDHPGHGIRRDVARQYHALCPRAEAWLGTDAPGFDPLPAGDGTVERRFTGDHGHTPT